MPLFIPEDYTAKLAPETMEQAITYLKEIFPDMLARRLRLRRVTAPLFVLSGTGINDDLNGVERAVSFPIRDLGDRRAEVVHSLAKWKRMKLGTYKIAPGYGLYTDMNAIRARRGAGQHPLALRRPVGLGTHDAPRRTQPELPESDRRNDLRGDESRRGGGLRTLSAHHAHTARANHVPAGRGAVAGVPRADAQGARAGGGPQIRRAVPHAASAANFPTDSGTTDAPRTTTTGAPRPKAVTKDSTATSSCGTRCWRAPSNFRAWASASTPRPSNATISGAELERTDHDDYSHDISRNPGRILDLPQRGFSG